MPKVRTVTVDDIEQRLAALGARNGQNIKVEEKPKRAPGRPRKPVEGTALHGDRTAAQATNARRRVGIGDEGIPRNERRTGNIDRIPVERRARSTENDADRTANDARPIVPLDATKQGTRRRNETPDGDRTGVNPRGNGPSGDTGRKSAPSGIRRRVADITEGALARVARIGADSEDEEDEEGPETGGMRERFSMVMGEMLEENAGVMSPEEVAKRKEETVSMIQDMGGYLNEFLSISNAARAKCDIWELDPKEAESIANMWLRRAQKSEGAAVTLRLALEGNTYAYGMLALGTRTWQTLGWYPQHGGFRVDPFTEKGPK